MKEFQLVKSKEYRACFWRIDGVNETSLKSIHPAIIFVTEASVVIRFSSGEKKVIAEGQFFLLPRKFTCQLSSEKPQKLVMLIIPDMTDLYTHFFSHLPRKDVNNFQELFYSLPINWSIKTFTSGLSLYIHDEKIDNQLAGIKVLELFHLIRHSFAKEFLILFFMPIFSKEYEFALFVSSNYHRVKTAKELAHLSHYTFSGFEKQFKKVFGVSPYQWMLQKKIDKVHWEIYKTSKPVKVIALENGFCSVSNLGDFCRKYFGNSPTSIRKKIFSEYGSSR